MTEPKEWTVMFYFASDNPLAPGVLSQLKAIKQAGFHPEANVIAQFDPQTVGTPTHIFEVNLINKLKSHGAANIGFAGNDPFVRNLLEDKLWRDQINRHGRLLRDELEELLEERVRAIDYDPPVPPDDRVANVPPRTGRSRELPPKQSLENFLKFCADRYPAKHYILFILGHGVVVGNDIFLFDEHTNEQTHSLSLVELGEVLTKFKADVRTQKASFDLVGFHSCSVSSLEVAYQLQGTATYMMAAQGPSFVGSWPYRQILIRLFNDLVRYGSDINVETMITKMFRYCLHNSVDFLLAGYSYDLCLCNLKKVGGVKKPLKALSLSLQAGLKSCLIRNLILLAHWRAQSFWQESYTDLYDFCFCLRRLCEEYECLHKPPAAMKELLERIQVACSNVIAQLVPKQDEPTIRTIDSDRDGRRGRDERMSRSGEQDSENFIVRAQFIGPAYQYSHGMSVFFPWSRPADDTQILDEYRGYKFNQTQWLDFLEGYFKLTLRKTRKDEEDEAKALALLSYEERCESYTEACTPKEEEDEDESGQSKPPEDPEQRFEQLLEDVGSLVYYDEGQLNNAYALAPKTDPKDPTGDESGCVSVKNYPRDTRQRARRGTKAGKPEQSVPISEDFLKHFQE